MLQAYHAYVMSLFAPEISWVGQIKYKIKASDRLFISITISISYKFNISMPVSFSSSSIIEQTLHPLPQ